MKLYGDPRSGSTRKVRWGLGEMGADVTLEVVEIAKGAHKSAPHVARHPMGKVPALADGDFVLWESDAILWYAADKTRRLVPEGAQDRARVQQWMSWNAWHLAEHTYKARAMRMMALRTGAPLDEAGHKAAVAGGTPLYALLDRALEGREVLVGTALSIADIAVGISVAFGREEGASLDAHPNVQRWVDTLVARPAYKAALPS